ncbi:MAG: pilus assembly protein N-terminal domain-containing protein [Pseudomonadota bacterium]
MPTLARTLVGAIVLLSCLSSESFAQEPDRKEVEVALNSSYYQKLGEGITRVSVGIPEIADVAPFKPDQILVTGKRIGETTATIWTERRESPIVLAIRVVFPVAAITKTLREAIPTGNDLRVIGAGRSLHILGEVKSPLDVEQATNIIEGFASSFTPTDTEPPRVVNSLVVTGACQVQLEVSYAEVSRTALRKMGLNLWAKPNAYAGGLVVPSTGIAGELLPLGSSSLDATMATTTGTATVPILGRPLSETFSLFFSSAGNSPFPFSATLSLLSARGYARTLSEPTLIALSGQEATFHAGGEFPILVPQGLDQISIEFKKYGALLSFTPTVVGDSIQLRLSTSTSERDESIGTTLMSVRVPGITQRQSSTTIRLLDGESFAVSGPLSDRLRSTVEKVPGLGDLPLLGAFFRSTIYRHEETEILVVVTAHIVHPQGERPALPGQDQTTDPSDLRLFLLGSHESLPNLPVSKRQGGKAPVGQVGFKR